MFNTSLLFIFYLGASIPIPFMSVPAMKAMIRIKNHLFSFLITNKENTWNLIHTVFVNCLFDNERNLKDPFVIKTMYALDINLNN